MEDFFRGVGIKVVSGSQQLGIFVSDRKVEDSCPAKKVQGWTESVKTLSGVALTQDCVIISTEVGICAAGHPQHWGHLRTSGTGA